MQIRFASQSYKSSSLPVSAQRVVNMYAEREPPDAKTAVALFGSAGILNFATAGSGPIRGLHVMNGIAYAVSGSAFYRIDSTQSAILLAGPNITGTGPVSMANNGTQICIVNGTAGYIYTVAAGLVQITDPDFYPADTVTFFDGYFIFNRSGTSQFFFSALYDGLTYDALDFDTADVQPGAITAVLNDHEQLMIFNPNCIETWYDAGLLTTPFQRYAGATIERGCLAPFSVLKEDNSIFFLGNDGVFYRLQGIVPLRVSTFPIETAWNEYPTMADCTAFSYTLGGHKFIVMTFPSAPATWVFDISTGLWHERESWNNLSVSYGRWRANCHAFAYDKHLVGDAYSGQVGYLDPEVFTEFTYPIRAQAVSPPIHFDRKRVFMANLELDIETGVGLASGQGSDPQIMLDWSDDGGRTYSNLQLWSSMGREGEYLTRLRWLRLGQFRQRILRINITDPVKRVIVSARADLEVGM